MESKIIRGNVLRGKEVKELIDPQRTNIHPKTLQRKMRSAKDGMRGKFLIGAYGCGACVLKKNCSQYPASKGICAVRAQLYVDYLKSGKGEIVPLMIDTLAKLSMERDIEQRKGIESGRMTEDYFKLSHLCIKLQEKIQNATVGTKATIKHEHSWLEEIRDAVNVGGRIIDDNNSSEPGTEEDLPGEVSESQEISQTD